VDPVVEGGDCGDWKWLDHALFVLAKRLFAEQGEKSQEMSDVSFLFYSVPPEER
jgi:hypothetical protein